MAESDVCAIEPLPGLAAIAPPDETGVTFEENAIQKALYYGAHTSGWLIAEDSGLEVDALDGAPGVHSARFAGPAATDEDNNRKLLDMLSDTPHRTASYVCMIALVNRGAIVRTFRGSVEGEILKEPRGANGFGYDPLFYYAPFGATFAEVSAERKQGVSHRGQALRALHDFLTVLKCGE